MRVGVADAVFGQVAFFPVTLVSFHLEPEKKQILLSSNVCMLLAHAAADAAAAAAAASCACTRKATKERRQE